MESEAHTHPSRIIHISKVYLTACFCCSTKLFRLIQSSEASSLKVGTSTGSDSAPPASSAPLQKSPASLGGSPRSSYGIASPATYTVETICRMNVNREGQKKFLDKTD